VTIAQGPLRSIFSRWNSGAWTPRLRIGSRVKALLIFETVRGTSQRDEGKDDSSHNCAYSKNYEEEYGEIRHRRT
jgi:hypothetical protein